MVDTKLPQNRIPVHQNARMRNVGMDILSSNRDYDQWYSRKQSDGMNQELGRQKQYDMIRNGDDVKSWTKEYKQVNIKRNHQQLLQQDTI